MSDFGIIFRADDGSLLVSSDSQCYERVAQVAVSSRLGNVSTYAVTTAAYPLVFVKCGAGQSAGVLAVEGSAGNWVVTVLATVSCPIVVFTPISEAASSGFGSVVYNTAGTAVFDSSKNILNARALGVLAESIAGIESPSGTDMVNYTSGPVKPSSSTNTTAVIVYRHSYVAVVYGIIYYRWRNGFNYPVYGYYNTTLYYTVFANVRTTNWSIDRGVAAIAPGGDVSFSWLRHQEGYYKEITGYYYSTTTGTIASSVWFTNFPAPSAAALAAIESSQGELTKDNTFPYTTNRANTGALTCITGVSGDYE